MDEIDRLISDLHNPDAKIVTDAAAALVKIGKPAVPAVIAAMDDENEKARMIASWVLMKIDFLKLCVFRLKDPDQETRENFARRINEYVVRNPEHPGLKELIPALIEALQDENEIVCLSIAQTLGEIKDDRAIPALSELFKRVSNLRQFEVSDALSRIYSQNPNHPDRRDSIVSYVRALPGLEEFAFKRLMEILGSCKTTNHIDDFEYHANDGLAIMKESLPDEWANPAVQSWICKFRNEIAKKRDSIANDKGIILGDKPKRPKNGPVFQQLRVMRNG